MNHPMNPFDRFLGTCPDSKERFAEPLAKLSIGRFIPNSKMVNLRKEDRDRVFVETGYGISTVCLLNEIEAQGFKNIRVISIDPDPYFLRPGRGHEIKAPNHRLIRERSVDALPGLYVETGPWTFFLHDSDHECLNQTYEFEFAYACLKKGALIACDDYTWANHRAWELFTRRHKLDFWITGSAACAIKTEDCVLDPSQAQEFSLKCWEMGKEAERKFLSSGGKNSTEFKPLTDHVPKYAMTQPVQPPKQIPHLTIAYMTNRREPMIKWFFDSLHRECAGDYSGIKVVVVDFFADFPGRRDTVSKLAKCPITHIPPKPNVWQGAYRLPSVDYFAASNARNTALCVAPDGYIVYVDDISMLVRGWLNEVRNVAAQGWVGCGSYEKVLGIQIENGELVGHREYDNGKDTRMRSTFTQDPSPCGGAWMFGCSAAIPVEALLKINGWDEDADSMGGEDYICGLMLEKNGGKIMYCPRMKTLESEELHHVESPFKRIIKPGNPDASHRLLQSVLNGGRITAPNYCNLREVRQKVLFENQPFPITLIPEHDWRDGQPLKEM